MLGHSLETCIESGKDNILYLRLGAALIVLFGHSYVVLGASVGKQEPMHRLFPGALSHTTGVMLFFTISGLLITLSWLRRPELNRFLRARALRIWPALAFCVVVTAFVIGPAVTSLSLHAYFVGDPQGTPLSFVVNNAVLKIRQFLPGVFKHNPYLSVNGSLWTLPVEATLYLCVAGLGILRCLRYPWLASLGIAAAFSWIVLRPMYIGQPVGWYGYILAGFFGAGSIACLLRRYVRVSTGIMLLVLGACILSRYTTHVLPVTWFAIGYFVLWFSYVPRLPAILKDFDLSYGTYLWAFPIQQLLVMAHVDSPLLIFAFASPIAIAIAAGSWFYIEKPALRLKDVSWFRAKAKAQAT